MRKGEANEEMSAGREGLLVRGLLWWIQGREWGHKCKGKMWVVCPGPAQLGVWGVL